MTCPSADDLLDAALSLADRGFRVFPLRRGAKLPLRKGWKESASNDPDEIRAMWTDERGFPARFNIGVLAEDLLVVDADVKSVDGVAALAQLDLPQTFTVETATGGRHIYLWSDTPIANSVRKLHDGLDVRGQGGFVVGPGSWLDPTENNGKTGLYRLAVDAPVAEAPPSLIAACGSPLDRTARDRGDIGADHPLDVAAARAWLETHEPAVEGLGGDQHTYLTIARLRDFGLTKATTLDLLEPWNARCAPPWDDEALERKIENVWAYAAKPIGSESLGSVLSDLGDIVNEPDPALKASGWFFYDDAFDMNAASWLVHETIPSRGVGLLVGESQAGKTFLAQHLAACLSDGTPWCKQEIDQRFGTVFLLGEHMQGFRKRVAGLRQHRGSDAGLIALAGRGVSNMSDDHAVLSLIVEIEQNRTTIEHRMGRKMGLLVIDTWSAAGLSVDETDNNGVAAAIARLNVVSERLGVFVLVLHHPTKSGSSTVRGGGALVANTDVVLNVEYDRSTGSRLVRIEKAKDAETGRVLSGFNLRVLSIGVDQKGRPITTCVVEEVEPAVRLMSAPPGWAQMIEARDRATGPGSEVVEIPKRNKDKLLDYGIQTGQIRMREDNVWVWVREEST